MKARSDVIASLRCWLLAKKPETRIAIEEHTDIIESRVLESLELVEFILFIEQESGREILRESLDPRTLRTLGGIYEHYFERALG
jgi:acyl carrier protein